MEYDYLVVGAGLFGAVFAREIKESGKKCLIIDKRNHIGGNVYTERKDTIDIHRYGAHIFHTSNQRLWDYVNKFADFNHYINKPKVFYKGKIYSFPINLMTLHQLYGVTNPSEARDKLAEVCIKIDQPANLEEWILSQVGKEIYEIFIKGYTIKQWQKDPKELPASIIKRLPIRLNFEENYFNDCYQGIPKEGYTKMVENILQGIEVKTNVDYFKDKDLWDSKAKKIVFTGKIDEYFGYEYGELEYRTLRFEDEWHEGNYQGNAVINYTDYQIPFTRIIEHKHFNFGTQNKTIITKEYPDTWHKSKIPYYPINDEKNSKVYNLYKKKGQLTKNIIFGGRLAEYKYYDMHQVIASALKAAEKELHLLKV